jgi:hypothetical protein
MNDQGKDSRILKILSLLKVEDTSALGGDPLADVPGSDDEPTYLSPSEAARAAKRRARALGNGKLDA